jgi:hypothetical protein
LKKKLKIAGSSTFTANDPMICELIPYSCQWSNQDWSCAYDSVLTSYFCLYLQLHPDMQKIWSTKSLCSKVMANLFDHLIQDCQNLTSGPMNNARDQFRDYLSSVNNDAFPRTGLRLVDITQITELIDLHNTEQMVVVCSYTVCGYNVQIPIAMRITYIPAPDLWASNAVNVGQDINTTCVTSETWIKIILQHAFQHVAQHDTIRILQHYNIHESLCGQTIQQTLYFQNSLPSSWTIEINPQLQPKTSQGEQLYYLRAIIYTGNQHFIA